MNDNDVSKEEMQKAGEEAIVGALKGIVEAVQSEDNNNIAQALAGYIAICAQFGLGPDDMINLMTQNGINGGDALNEFIHVQYKAMMEAVQSES